MYQMAIDYCDGKGYKLVGQPTADLEALKREVAIYNMGADYSTARVVSL